MFQVSKYFKNGEVLVYWKSQRIVYKMEYKSDAGQFPCAYVKDLM